MQLKQVLHSESLKKKFRLHPHYIRFFDEILANAADNVQRDSKMSKIYVDIDDKSGQISIFNDGESIPVRMHEKEKMYIPELVLGNLMTGSNLMIMLDALLVEDMVLERNLLTSSRSISKLSVLMPAKDYYTIKWENNMQKRHDPEIQPYHSKASYVRVTFQPDLSRFSMKSLADDDTARVMERRVIDVAGVNPHLDVQLNGKAIPISDSFQSYAALYQPGVQAEPISCKPNKRWEVCVMPSPDGVFEQFSFVNSLTTFRGGTHVNVVADQIARNLVQQINSKHSKVLDQPVTPMQVKSHMWLFVKCLIENPSFDSQTKEYLETPPNLFGKRMLS